jgi:UDP-4-amino-4,6-dideoxy-N-acetyl-beta-L-altrosamine transaminase
MIPYGRQSIDEDDIAAVVATLRSAFLTQGPAVAQFEAALCSYTGATYCVAVCNATAGLHMAVAALELPAGSEGVTSPNTFLASANCMAYCNVKPVFADIEPQHFNIDPVEVQARITDATRVLVPVHFAGHPADMVAIAEIARKHRLRVIEDAAHAIGSRYEDGGMVGNCRHSDMTVFSFHPVKTITTGEGGAITTNDPELYRRLLRLRSHGMTKDPQELTSNPGPWYYEMQSLGFNYRLTDLQAALGITQLAKLDQFAARRKAIIAQYNRSFSQLDWMQAPLQQGGVDACFHLYATQIDFPRLGKTRQQAMQLLLAQGVGTQVHYIPVHTQPWYRSTYGYQMGDYPAAESYYERALSLPLFPAMSDAEVARVVTAIQSLP